ncbi:hypothetical protein FZC76_07000 [Sutcliffiella horikoshii]|uniref:Uncharacterized protein n=1 Tax=Sutcliffiella horikoshii TaxID=79883 RepID=A0A5D4T3F5_9BACI|nr:hypothetical protein [Sutcliffiella horikoshii]TYS68686.1 hypothetical protein FZC76_07000 [Sutcliffiella horikoshii]
MATTYQTVTKKDYLSLINTIGIGVQVKELYLAQGMKDMADYIASQLEVLYIRKALIKEALEQK